MKKVGRREVDYPAQSLIGSHSHSGLRACVPNRQVHYLLCVWERAVVGSSAASGVMRAFHGAVTTYMLSTTISYAGLLHPVPAN